MSIEKSLDLICLGRSSVDLYGQQIGSRLEDMSSFAKYLGGCATNIAYGTAKLGLKSSLITRVGDEHMGRFIVEELKRGGVDTSQVITDKERLTALVILGIKNTEEFPLIFYRSDCADMALTPQDINEQSIASSKALLITGTHLSAENTFAASQTAVDYAKSNNTKVILDLDYRPVLWGLTGIGEGENRFVASAKVTQKLQSVVGQCDLIVGTEEEFNIAGASTDIIQSLNAVRRLTEATLVLKLGPLGCTVIDAEIPQSAEQFRTFGGVSVEVLNVLGAGDGFLSGFLRGWIRGESYQLCCTYANACGALVVSRHGCAPASPSAQELDDYLARASTVPRPDRDQRLTYLHRVDSRDPQQWDNLCVMAFDHRKQFFDMARECGASPRRIPHLKQLLARAFCQVSEQVDGVQTGLLADDTYGQEVLNQLTGNGYWIARPVELPQSRPLEFEGGASIGEKLASWPRQQVVKCLVYYHPEDPAELRLAQERKMLELYSACQHHGLELLLEIIPPQGSKRDKHLANSIQRCYHLGIYPDWWKLPPPADDEWQDISQIIQQQAPQCRGVLLLGLDVPLANLEGFLKTAKQREICKGFAVGRSIFGAPSRQWLAGKISDGEYIEKIKNNYLLLIDAWRG